MGYVKGSKWQDHEVAKLRELVAQGHNYKSAATYLGRTPGAVGNKIRQFCSEMDLPTRRKWSLEEMGFLQDHPDMTHRQAGEALNRTEGAVRFIRRQMRRQ